MKNVNSRNMWTRSEDMQLATIVVDITRKGGSMADGLKHAARELGRPYEGTKTRFRNLRGTTQNFQKYSRIDNGVRVTGDVVRGLGRVRAPKDYATNQIKSTGSIFMDAMPAILAGALTASTELNVKIRGIDVTGSREDLRIILGLD